METGVRIVDVVEGSLAEESDIQPGDCLLSINGLSHITDILQYKEALLASEINLQIMDQSGQVRFVKVSKDPYAELGLVFESGIFDRIRSCRNNCSFCFVRQLPAGMRKSLYVKDDDYRLSFLEGSFITLTNLVEEDFERIISSRISPLYISVHSFDPTVRKNLMGNPGAARIFEDLKRLALGGVQFHLQLVLIPGVNDGIRLVESVQATQSLGSACLSLGVVPVGLTGHRKNLPQLKWYEAREAKGVLDIVTQWQAEFYQERGERVVYAADEFYWLADRPFPQDYEYEGYPQLENGIGLTRLFWDNFQEYFRPGGDDKDKYLIVTGASGSRALQLLLLGLPAQTRDRLRLVTVPNSLFGGRVTVSGLLGGSDISQQLLVWQSRGYGDWKVLLPEVVFNAEGKTLDDWSLADIRSKTGLDVSTVEPLGVGLSNILSKKKYRYLRCIHE